MPYCQKCGAELSENTKFCTSCGIQIGGERSEYRYHKEREACFGGKGTGLWGAISGGVFLIGLAVLWFLNWWWPGILFLVGIIIIIGGFVSYVREKY